jgi:spermidine/putrescine transport system ATP-binding protein
LLGKVIKTQPAAANAPEVSPSDEEPPSSPSVASHARPAVAVAAALVLRGVGKRFQQQLVVRDVSLEIRRGEFFSILGPSGCGKTTLLRLIAGFEQPDTGEIHFADRAPDDRRPAYAREVNLVFQHYALFPHMTVAQNVAFGLEMAGVPAAERQVRVAEALALVRLTGFEGRYPRQLSGGQQQRVALARAIVTHPSVLLLDEPLGALDLKLRKAMQLELKNLQRRLGMTFIYVTHDQEEALALSDRLAVMHHGRVLQVGTPTEIYEHPRTRFVADFIGGINFLEGRVLASAPPLALVQVGGLEVRVRDSEGALRAGEAVVLAIRPEKIAIGKRRVAARENNFSGVVEDALYLGTDTQYAVRLGEGLRLDVRAQNLKPESFRCGERVVLSWAADAISAVQPDPD